MDTKFKEILDGLPEKPPRSRLEPYRKLIEELRRRGRTYRDIAAILGEKCRVQVTASGVHDFVRTRSRVKRAAATVKTAPAAFGKSSADAAQRPSADDEVEQRIVALKARKPVTKAAAEFQFDPTQPLRLKKPGKSASDK